MLDKSIFTVILDSAQPNSRFQQRLLQGNTDFAFHVQIAKNQKIQTIPQAAKITLYLVYKTTAGGTWKTRMIEDTDTEYAITVTDNTIVVPATVSLVDYAGEINLILKVTDGTDAYVYSMLYTMDRNEAYSPVGIINQLPVWDSKANKDLSNVAQADFDRLLAQSGGGIDLSNYAKKDLSNVTGGSTALADMPKTRVANKYLKVNSAGAAYELVDTPTPPPGKTAQLAGTAAVTIPLDAKNIFINYSFSGTSQQIVQALPDTSTVESGTTIYITITANDETNSIRFDSASADTIAGGRSVTITGKGDLAILVSGQGTWAAFQVVPESVQIQQMVRSLANIRPNEIITKDAAGEFAGAGILAEDDKIYFDKEARFPSGSIDIGPAITISENGGWVENTSQTLGKKYIMLDYEVDSTGSQRPIVWTRAAEEQNVIISATDTSSTSFSQFTLPINTDMQINALFLNFKAAANNVLIQVCSTVTNQPVKYIPSEAAWRAGTGGLNLAAGVHDLLVGITPFSVLTSYQITCKFKTPVTLASDGTTPWIKVNLQRIIPKSLLYLGEGTGSSDTAEQVRDKLQSLSGEDRLDAQYIKALPSTDALASKTLSNVGTLDFEKKFQATDAYRKIAEYMNTTHTMVIQQAVELQPAAAVNLSTTAGSIIYLDYQFAGNGQTIRQQLPPNAQNKYIMFSTMYPNPYSGTQIILSPATGEYINGNTADLIITRDGFLGFAIPTSNGYIWMTSTELSSETGTTIKNKLELLSGDGRLDASAIKNLPGTGGGGSETGETIKTKLEALQGTNRLSATAIKDLPGVLTAPEIRDLLETLTGEERLEPDAIRGLAEYIRYVAQVPIDGGAAASVQSDSIDGGGASAN